MAGHSVYVVTGASRGLGFEFVKQLVKRGNTVVATARNPSSAAELMALHDEHPKSMSLVTIDTSDASSVEAAGKKIAELHPEGIDVLINNAGLSGKGVRPTELDVSEFPEIYKTNTIGPYLMIRALLPLIRKGEKKQIFQISSTMGSAGNLAANLYGGGRYEHAAQVQLPYRASKAALNMVTVCMAADLLSEGITVISMCPGHVRTDMGGEKGECEAPESIAGQLKVFDSVSINDTGKFFNFEGKTVPY